MAKQKKLKPTCKACSESRIHFGQDVSEKSDVILRKGQRYCAYCEQIRQFLKRDSKCSVPLWCPRRKRPPEYRVYHYKNAWTELERLYLRIHGFIGVPYPYEYGIYYEGRLSCALKDIQKSRNVKELQRLLCMPMYVGDVVEMDNGLLPYFFM